ncbi:hypothetical protein DFP73DRAFT_115837 [Morchella snyderi]|nr:hypothetical protein DFP73DRAFT_115837 [Morchella snyderi]
MYPRGRTGGRDRSRDPSRNFQQGGRERDYQRSYRNNRDREGPYRDETTFERRGGGRDVRDGRERDRDGGREREPHPPPAPPPVAPSAPAPLLPPTPLLPEQQSSYTREQSSVLSRRGSITREPLPPLDPNSRRQPGAPSTRKETFAEPSPRERGMIGDPQGGPPSRRQISGPGPDSWGGDDRARSETQRNSVELNNSHRLSRSPAGSPRSAHRAASPTTSAAATPTTTNSTINFTSALMPPSALSYSTATAHSGGKEQRYAGIFQEASFAYCKYLEALNNFKAADKECRDHAEHFNLFPVMRERYEGNARAAKKELNIAQEALRHKSMPLEELCRQLFKEHAVNTGTENAIAFFQKIQKELGNSSLTQFVKSNAPAPAVVPSGPSKSEFQQLRDELQNMKKKQEEDEKMRQNFHNEFHNYKNSQSDRFRSLSSRQSKIEVLQKKLETEVEQTKHTAVMTEEGLKTAMTLLTEVKGDVEKLQEAASAKGSTDVVMGDAGDDIGTVSEQVKKLFETLETIQKTLVTTQQKLAQTASKCANDIKGLEQKISKLDIKELQASQIQGALPLQEYATKSDILRLEDHMRQQDNLIDNVRIGIEGDTALVSETIHLLETTLEKNNQETGERFQALEQTRSDGIKNLTSLQERNRAAHIEEIKSLRGEHQQLATNMVEVGNRVGYVESQLEGHAVAISHVDRKMTNFTTKDFYERVIQELMKINPMIFSQTHQLSSVCSEVKTMKDALRILGERLKQLTEQRNINANLSPHSVLDAASAQDGPSNGALKSDSSEGPSPSLTSAIADIDTLRTRVDGVEKGLTDHIAAYHKRINDIKDWTVSASERLALHTESAAAISEDIKSLREYLASLGSLSGSPVQIPNAAGTDRWRAVASYQDQMQGITSSSNENGNTVGNGNGNGNF